MNGPFSPGAAGIAIRRAAGFPCPPPPGLKVKPDGRLSPGWCIGYRDGVVAWTGSLKVLGDAPTLDLIVVSDADYAAYLEMIG